MSSDQPTKIVRACAVAHAALIAPGDGERSFGVVAGLDALPRNMRRRLSAYDRMIARCVAGLSDEQHADETIVLASCYGNMKLTLDLLDQLVSGEMMSPAAFSASVHNAAAGLASLATKNRGGHTAIAAGEDCPRAGLIEAWLRLSTGEDSVLLVIADEPLPGDYASFDSAAGAPAACLALRLIVSSDASSPLEFPADGGRAGLIDLIEQVSQTPVGVACRL